LIMRVFAPESLTWRRKFGHSSVSTAMKRSGLILFKNLLTDQGRAERMGRIAYSVVEGDRGVMDRSIALVSRYLYP